MRNNEEYTIKELLKDDFFLRWVFNPDEESNHYWTEVLNKNPESRAAIDKAREILSLMGYEQKQTLKDDEYADMLNVLIRENNYSKFDHASEHRKWSFTGIAASIVLVVAVGLSVYFSGLTNSVKQDAVVENDMEFKKTSKGERLTIKLRDGTKVKLNAVSSLSYKTGFSGDKREVYLEGEAYFDVKSDPERPFIIHTGDIKTTVLGTKFNVRSHEKEKNIEVTVVEGKVKVGLDQSKYTYLSQDEVGIYQKEENNLNKVKGDISNNIAWYNNMLVFDNATADEVWERLENWYGVNIVIQNEDNIEGRYSGIYENEPLETVLRGVSFASGFKYEINKNKNVIIK